MRCPKVILAAVFTVLVNLPAVASGEGHVHRQHASHQHGSAQLNLAIEDGQIEMEMESPATNIVGFEHRPVSDEDVAAVQAAVQRLEDGAALFVFPAAAGCRLVHSEVDSELLTAQGQQAPRGGAHRHEVPPAHADFDAAYQFDCTNPAALKQLDVRLFQAFPALERLQLQSITASGQAAIGLTPERHVIHF